MHTAAFEEVRMINQHIEESGVGSGMRQDRWQGLVIEKLENLC